MKIRFLLRSVLALGAAVALQQASAQPISLTGNSYTNTFDDMEAEQAVPSGWTLYTGATASAPGTIASFSAANYTASSNSWRSTTGRFANQASTFSYTGGTNFLGTETNNPVQWTEPNRCLALRQTGSLGDPGGAFVLKLADTLNRKDFVLSVDFLNLDPTSTRTTTWKVDFGLGTVPSFFVPLATWVNTPGTFNTYHTNISLPNGTIDNDSGPVWIRIVALSPSTGSGNRETSAIDNFGLTWSDGSVCTPVSIAASPASASAFINGSQSFTVGALGTKPLSYVWLKNGSTVLSDDFVHISGASTPTLTLTGVQPDDAGTYSCTVANTCDSTPYTQTSGAATLTVSTPPAVSISYLHTLVSPSTWAPTNSTLLYQATGIITTYTNTTTANTASYYLQDGTGGINLFCTFGSSFRPSIGDVVTAVGFLSSFGGNLELEADLSNSAQSVTVLSNNIAAYPAAKLVAWDNLFQFGTNASLNYNLQGAVVLLTNVYFGTNAGVLTTNGNYNLVVTNALGKVARVLLPAALDNDLTNRTLPTFAAAIQGPLIATTGGYQVMPTRWTDIVTTVPSITLDTPTNDASFAAPANIELAATVTSNGYDISAVNFYNGGTLLGSATTSPYTYAWNDVGPSTNALSAKAVYSLFGNNLSAASTINTVTVNAANPPPVIVLDTPTNTASFVAPADLTLSATVTSNLNAISYVAFYNGASLIATVTNTPYSYTWTGVGAGDYSVWAQAFYGAGSDVVSGTNNVSVVNPVAPVISGISGNSLSYSGGVGTRFILLKTADLTAPMTDWTRDQTNTAPSGSFPIPVGSEDRAFYTIKSE